MDQKNALKKATGLLLRPSPLFRNLKSGALAPAILLMVRGKMKVKQLPYRYSIGYEFRVSLQSICLFTARIMGSFPTSKRALRAKAPCMYILMQSTNL